MQKKEEEILGGERFRMIMLKGLNQLKTNKQKTNPRLLHWWRVTKLEQGKGMNWI